MKASVFGSKIVALAATVAPFITSGSAQTASRTITVTNNCPFTIWPAINTGGDNVPSQPAGWVQASGATVSFSVPYNWETGRIWGRTECNFSNPASTSCATGSCNGGLVCTAGGVPPATLAEFTLGVNGNPDYYDVSLVNGNNLPMKLTSSQGCPTASCPVDLNPSCPSALILRDSSGITVGCKSACVANLDGNPSNSPNCCSGSYDTPQTCPSSGVQYYSYFKNNCPNTYSYPFDESSGTALFSCSSSLESDYTIVFCP